MGVNVGDYVNATLVSRDETRSGICIFAGPTRITLLGQSAVYECRRQDAVRVEDKDLSGDTWVFVARWRAANGYLPPWPYRNRELTKTALERQVQSREAQGAVRVALGSCEMPEGYALMRDLADGTFFWLRFDGAESPRHYSRWEVWELARLDSDEH